MSLQYKFFSIFLHEAEEAENSLNRFLRSVRVVQVERHFVDRGECSYWSLMVEYLAGVGSDGRPLVDAKKKVDIDYKQILSPEDFRVFAQLRIWRKNKALEEGIPAYTIFTNEHLARIAENRTLSATSLREIEGIGEAKMEKHGAAVLQICQAARQENGEGKMA